jgi:hypothetical protein
MKDTELLREKDSGLILFRILLKRERVAQVEKLTDWTRAISGRLFSDAIAVIRFCFNTHPSQLSGVKHGTTTAHL